MTARLTVVSPRRPDALARIRVDPAGMSAECPKCRVALEQRPGADARTALRRFLEAHPLSRRSPHSAQIPPGWQLVTSRRPGSAGHTDSGASTVPGLGRHRPGEET
jgi:hypothetical protein